MTDTLLALLPHYGAPLLALITFLSCIAVPVPASLIMLAGGAFAAGGDLSPWLAGPAAFTGAVLGDQAGFGIGRWGTGLIARIEATSRKRAFLVARARAFSSRWGAPGVFLSRWLVSPLGPYVNFLSGAAGLGWALFTLWSVLGEALWVSLYVGLGYRFSGQIEALADILVNASGTLAAALVTALLGGFLWKRAHEHG